MEKQKKYSKSLLGLEKISKTEIATIIDRAFEIEKEIEKGVTQFDTLKGKKIVTLFYENSTRTKNSFENAAKALGAGVTSVAVATSSVQKGESLIDTGHTLDRLFTDLIIIRHPMSGASAILNDNVKASVINAGDGMHEHPTQALLDLFTIIKHKGSPKGKKVLILGDIKHSRVARSNIYALNKYGAKITVCGPQTLLPFEIKSLGVEVESDFDRAIENVDIIIALRIQKERQKQGLFPSMMEYSKYYEITSERLKKAKKDLIILHPGPVNRDVEVSTEVINNQKIYKMDEQVTNGLIVRMALLECILGDKK